jgi:hypothetical protein
MENYPPHITSCDKKWHVRAVTAFNPSSSAFHSHSQCAICTPATGRSWGRPIASYRRAMERDDLSLSGCLSLTVDSTLQLTEEWRDQNMIQIIRHFIQVFHPCYEFINTYVFSNSLLLKYSG